MTNSLLSRHRHMSDQIKLVMRIFRKQGNTSFKFMRHFVNDRSKVR
jgi:hypothetical protein